MKLSLSRFVDHFFIFQFFVFKYFFPFQTSNVFSLPSSSLSANKSRFSIILSSSEFLSLLVSVSVFSRLQIVVSSTTTTTTTTTREKRSLPHQTHRQREEGRTAARIIFIIIIIMGGNEGNEVAIIDERLHNNSIKISEKDGLKPIELLHTQTRSVGVIIPPPDVRAIVDKTAQFVAKNGPEFENRILSSEKNNQKFSFLMEKDPYHAYYRGKIESIKLELEGKTIEDQNKKGMEVAEQVQNQSKFMAKSSAVGGVGLSKPEVLERPREFKHSIGTQPPQGLKKSEIEVIKLSAQFVARNGAKFLSGLASREYQNPEFAFLKPAHPLFTYFTSLADSYSEILMPENKQEMEEVLDVEVDYRKALERSLKRSEWDATQLKNRKDNEEKKRMEREAMEAIDWHDFVVVETIDFEDGEDETLPEPIAMREIVGYLKRQALEDASKVEAQPPTTTANDVVNEEIDVGGGAGGGTAVATMDDEERQIMQQAQEVEKRVKAASRPLAPNSSGEKHASGINENLPEPGMKIVRNYKKPEERAAASRGDKATKFAVSPITGELVPVDEMAEHMRISLIDPKWKEQKDAMLKKLQGSNKVDDDQFAKNIVSLAKSRPDIFASGNDKDVSTALNEQMKKQQQQQQVAQPAHAIPAMTQPIPPPPMMSQQAMPPPPPLAAPAMDAEVGQKRGRVDGDDEDAKPVKQKLRIGEMELEEENEWLSENPGTIDLKILCPDEAKDKNLNGQTIDLKIESGKETVLKIKQELKPLLGNLAQGKMKLEIKRMGFLKDANSLAYYNIKSGTPIHLHLKKR